MEYFLFVVIIFTIFQSAKAENNNETILNLLNNTEGLHRFGSWWQEVAGYYDGRDAITVFAFHDAGYDVLPSEERQVFEKLDASGQKSYVRDFTVEQKYDIGDLYDGEKLLSALGKPLFVNKKDVTSTKRNGIITTFINGVPIVEGINGTNGIIHILERPPRPISDQNILEFIDVYSLENDTAGILMNALMERLYIRGYFSSTIAPLTSVKMTFFLPSREALERIPYQELSALSDQHLANVFKMNFIPRHAVFTGTVLDGETFSAGNLKSQITFHKDKEEVYVRAGGVTARIVKGNIAVDNGVIHIIDGMLGFVYQTARQQINQDARNFSQMVMNASMETKQLILQSTGLCMFVPVDSAFASIGNLVGVDIGSQTQIDMVIRLSMFRDGSLSISQMGDGNYESRQRRVSRRYDDTLYSTEVWVNGGNVRAKIIRSDVGVTNGMLQYIDSILGIPTMDIPALINDDDYLLRSYSELRRVHLHKYLGDSLYEPPPNVDDSLVLHSNQTLHTNESLWCDETCSDNTTAGDPAMCKFTVFLPSSLAFEQFYNETDYAANITQDLCRFRFVLRRHVIPNVVISLEEMIIAAYGTSLKADSGDEIAVQKPTENDVMISWGQQHARAIMWDLGATNGIVHIVDAILTDSDDEWIDIGSTTSTSTSSTTTMSTVLPTVKTTESISAASVFSPTAISIYVLMLIITFSIC